MKVGDSARYERQFDDADLRGLGAIIGAELSLSQSVPEPLIAALFSYLLGVDLPGSGTNYLKQDIEFLAAAPVGKPLIARVTITRLRPDKHLCDLETTAETSDGVLVAKGRALVLIKDVGSAAHEAD